ncbi:MAG: NAD-dependent epimerase/dehydratase family protein [Phycisphaeraceae bacterium]|nr:NAD-dependent epimerase/dehydratase family protein [Phycisphaeraceae bacterium]
MIIHDWTALHANHFADARILVTGGAGFIGSHLTEALLQLGAEVVVLDDLSGGAVDNLEPFASAAKGRFQFVQGSILDGRLLKEAIAGCRFVFHQAALGSVPASVADPKGYAQVNIMGTLSVLQAAVAAGVQRVQLAASAAAYGDDPTVPKLETMPTAARSPYAATKIAGEALLAAFSANSAVDTVSLRYFNIFGPRQNANSAYAAVIAAFAKDLLAGRAPRVFGDGEQTRDLTFVHNVVHANLLAARHGRRLDGMVLNVATGQAVTINQLAKMMTDMLGRQDLAPVHEALRAGDVRHSRADLTRIQHVLGYKPVVDFADGLAATVAWYRATHF